MGSWAGTPNSKWGWERLPGLCSGTGRFSSLAARLEVTVHLSTNVSLHFACFQCVIPNAILLSWFCRPMCITLCTSWCWSLWRPSPTWPPIPSVTVVQLHFHVSWWFLIICPSFVSSTFFLVRVTCSAAKSKSLMKIKKRGGPSNLLCLFSPSASSQSS